MTLLLIASLIFLNKVTNKILNKFEEDKTKLFFMLLWIDSFIEAGIEAILKAK